MELLGRLNVIIQGHAKPSAWNMKYFFITLKGNLEFKNPKQFPQGREGERREFKSLRKNNIYLTFPLSFLSYL